MQILTLIVPLAHTISVEQCEQALERIDRYDAVMPIIDPTAYRDSMRQAERNTEIVQAFTRFRRVIEQEAQP